MGAGWAVQRLQLTDRDIERGMGRDMYMIMDIGGRKKQHFHLAHQRSPI